MSRFHLYPAAHTHRNELDGRPAFMTFIDLDTIIAVHQTETNNGSQKGTEIVVPSGSLFVLADPRDVMADILEREKPARYENAPSTFIRDAETGELVPGWPNYPDQRGEPQGVMGGVIGIPLSEILAGLGRTGTTDKPPSAPALSEEEIAKVMAEGPGRVEEPAQPIEQINHTTGLTGEQGTATTGPAA